MKETLNLTGSNKQVAHQGGREPIRVRHLPQEDRTNGWSTILPPRTAKEPLAHALKVDWLVIGAGYAGLAAARRLAQLAPSASIAVLDAGVVGDNASGRNSGFAIDVPHNVGSSLDELAKARHYQRLLAAGVQQLEALVGQHGIACDWRQAGKYHCAVSPQAEKTLRHHADELDRLGQAHQFFRRDDLAPRLGTSYFRSGIYTPGCILLNPAALCRGLADSLPANVALFENSPVVALDVGSKEVRAQTAGGGSVVAGRLIMANNAFAQQLGFFRGETYPMVSFGSLSKPLNEDQQRRYGVRDSWGLTPANAVVGATMRFTDDRRMLIRQGFLFPKNFKVSQSQRDHAKRTHVQVFAARFPNLTDVDLEHFWMGTLAVTRNGAPRWGAVAPNVHVVAGCNGVGIVKQTILGTLLVEHALGLDNPLIADALALGAPTRSPALPFLELGAKAYLAKEIWAGRKEF